MRFILIHIIFLYSNSGNTKIKRKNINNNESYINSNSRDTKVKKTTYNKIFQEKSLM